MLPTSAIEPSSINPGVQGVKLNPLTALNARWARTGSQLASATSKLGVLNGCRQEHRVQAISGVDQLLRTDGRYVDITIAQQDSNAQMDCMTDVAIRFIVQNNDVANDCILVPSPFLINRIEVQLDGATVDTYYSQHLWYHMRDLPKERTDILANLYGFSDTTTPGSCTPASGSSTLQDVRGRQFLFGTGATDILSPGNGQIARYVNSSASGATVSLAPGSVLTTAAVAGLEFYDCKNAVLAGFVPRGGQTVCQVILPESGLWDGHINLNQLRTRISFRVYFNGGSTSIFDSQSGRAYVGGNVQSHQNAAQLQVTVCEAVIGGMRLFGAARDEFNSRHQQYAVISQSLAPRYQNNSIDLIPAANADQTITLTSLSTYYKSLLWFIVPNQLQGRENNYQMFKRYDGATQRLVEILDRRAFQFTQFTLNDQNGQPIWNAAQPGDMSREFNQFTSFKPCGSAFNSAMRYVEFCFSGLPAGDNEMGRHGGLMSLANNCSVQFRLGNIGLFTAAGGVAPLSFWMLAYEYAAFLQDRDGSVIKLTAAF